MFDATNSGVSIEQMCACKHQNNKIAKVKGNHSFGFIDRLKELHMHGTFR